MISTLNGDRESSMSSHPDADAFLQAILDNPSELTTRLVFADWLEDTGEPSNIAWAHFIRLNAEVNQHPEGSFEHDNLEWRTAQLAPRIHATLTIPAAVFVAHSQLFQELLPSHQFVVKLTEYAIPQRALLLVPEFIARENRALPLAAQGRLLFLALANSRDWDMVQKLQSDLSRFIVPVGATANEILEATNRNYTRPGEILGLQFWEVADTDLELPEDAQSADSPAPAMFPFQLELT
jgi:uncharacterized protein (TIGR02996 family)